MHARGFDGRGDDARPAAAGVLSVTALTRRIGAALEGLGRVAVEGEVSKVQRAASGHLYFELKDLDSRISCAVWRSQVASAVRFDLREGAQVIAHGKLDVYGPKGGYSLIVQRLEPAGLGALLAQLEALKQDLRARGWFDRKRELPRWPRCVGLVTSRDAAAFADFLRTRSQRWPGYPLRFCHTAVQGQNAAAQIARAIERLDASGVDVICVVRGGGSLEDLWAFNERAVAEAIWNSRAPVVSGVGHETDTTLCDLVADQRAHTPTDAAQRVIPDRAELLERLERSAARMGQALDTALARAADRVERAASSPALRDPLRVLELRGRELVALQARLGASLARRLELESGRLEGMQRALLRVGPQQQLAARQMRVQLAAAALPRAAQRLGERAHEALERAHGRLEALSPLAVLQRGYTITRVKGQSAPLTQASAARAGDELETRTADGLVSSRVLDAGADAT